MKNNGIWKWWEEPKIEVFIIDIFFCYFYTMKQCGEYSSGVEQRIVVPLVVGSIPIARPIQKALMAELVDAIDSKSSAARRVSSTLTEGTTYYIYSIHPPPTTILLKYIAHS